MSKSSKPVGQPAPERPILPRPPRKSGIVFVLMALYQFAHDGKFSGRMQGNVMQRNGRSRAFIVPPLVRSAYTSAARGLFSTYSSLYASLTALQILAWQAFSYISGSDRFGNPVVSKGKQAFVALNVNLADVGGAAIADPPVLTGVINPEGAAGTSVGSTSVAVSWTSGALDASTDVKVMMARSRPVSKFASNRTKQRFLAVIPNGTVSPFSLTAAYTARFGSLPITGEAISFTLQGVNNRTGQKIVAGGGRIDVS